jgi:hypothetical protein
MRSSVSSISYPSVSLLPSAAIARNVTSLEGATARILWRLRGLWRDALCKAGDTNAWPTVAQCPVNFNFPT